MNARTKRSRGVICQFKGWKYPLSPRQTFVIYTYFILPKDNYNIYKVRSKENKWNTHHHFINLILLKTINLTKTTKIEKISQGN
jgi:hypothetical protein